MPTMEFKKKPKESIIEESEQSEVEKKKTHKRKKKASISMEKPFTLKLFYEGDPLPDADLSIFEP